MLTMTEPWFCAIACVLCIIWLFTTRDESAKLIAAYCSGMWAAGIGYNVTIKRMLKLNRSMLREMEAQQQMVHAVFAMKTREIGQSIAEHIGANIIEGPTRPSMTKH